MEVIERDAFLLSWYGQAALPRSIRTPAPARPAAGWWTGWRCTATRPASSTPASPSRSP
ncbi:hypothetical protein NKH18_20780 [Streptomyces sp. M10(2022)]